MKVFFKKLFIFATCLCLTLTFNVISYAYNANAEFKDLDNMQPYRDIVEKVNNEFGQTLIKFPTNKELQELGFSTYEAYDSLKNTNLAEFENRVRELAKSASSIETNVHYNAEQIETYSNSLKQPTPIQQNIQTGYGTTDSKEDNTIQPRYIRENITQFVEFGSGDNFGRAYLESTVFSAQGTSYTYEKIGAHGCSKYSDRIYFHGVDSYAVLDSSRKNCTVEYKGYPYDPIAHVMLTVKRTVTITFSI